jgi:hypothetical protein
VSSLIGLLPKDNPWIPRLHAISKRIAASITTARDTSSVPLGLIGQILSAQFFSLTLTIFSRLSRTKENLRNGHLQVSGDQWPIFLYYEYSYDPDDPWKGLLRSAIIVSVSLRFLAQMFNNACLKTRHINIFFCPQVLSARNLELRVRGMPVFTA